MSHIGQSAMHLESESEQHGHRENNTANPVDSVKPAVAFRHQLRGVRGLRGLRGPIDERRCPDRRLRRNQISYRLADRVIPQRWLRMGPVAPVAVRARGPPPVEEGVVFV